MEKGYCHNCGSEIEISEKYRFCGNCGFPVPRVVSNDSVVEDEKNDPVSPQETSSSNNESTRSYNCYARYVSTSSTSSTFQEPDGTFLYLPNNKTASMGKLIKGEYYWLRVTPKEGGGKWTYPVFDDKEHVYLEYVSFASKYKQNDRLVLPVKALSPQNCMVMIGPTAFVNVPRDAIDKTYKSSEIRTNKAYFFTVKKISKNDGKVNIELEFSGSAKMRVVENLYTKIPDTISDITISYKNVELLVNDNARCEAVQQAIGPINQANLARFIDKEYQKQKQKKTLVININGRGIRIDVDLGIKDANGVPIRACVNKKKERDKFVLSLIGGTSPTSEMERFVYVPDWEKFCGEIANLALPEKWGYDEDDRFSILESYLKMTYYKARLDSLLIENDDGALFNTGLVDATFDDIYCYLKKAKSVDDPYDREWTPGFFACRGKGKDGKRLNELFAYFPPVPSYISREQIENIYFDTRKDLFCDYYHILEDNLNRLPESFVSQTLAYDSRVRTWSDQHGTIDEIKEYVLSKPDLVKGLEDQLKSAVETARKYCKWNYKTAIPIYYPRTNNISLLLPLSVVKGSSTVDTALVIQLLPNGNYQGQTILTLEMAYKDARQICRPNSEWLTLEAVKDAVHSEDEDSDD